MVNCCVYALVELLVSGLSAKDSGQARRLARLTRY